MPKNDSVHPIGATRGGRGSSRNKSDNGHDTTAVTTAWKWRTYQDEIINVGVDAGGVGLIALPTGSGKTAVSLEIVRRLLDGRDDAKVLIVAPINTHSGWERHLAMFLPDLTVRRINSTKVGREAEQDALAGKPGAYIVGWEWGRGAVRHQYQTLPDGTKRRIGTTVIREQMDWSKVALDAAIVDESARLGNRKSVQTEVVWTAKGAPIKLCLSATPAGNKIENIWSTLHFLWPDKFKHFWPWVRTFLSSGRSPYHSGIDIHGEKRPGIVAKSIPVYERRSEEEVHGELPGVVTHMVEVDLSPQQRRIYTQFEKDALAWLDEHPVAAELPITKMIRLREVCLGVPSVQVDDETGEETVMFRDNATSAKLDMMEDILTDTPPEKKVIVWTHSRKIIPAVMRRLKDDAVAFTGGLTPRQRTERLAEFLEGDKRVLVSTIPALAEGFDGAQHVASVEIWLSHDENLMLNRQAQGRLFRPGQKHTINRYAIVAKNTLETRQLGRLKTTELKLLEGGML